MNNREAHEEAAGMSLDDSFFTSNNIDPDAEYIEDINEDGPTQPPLDVKPHKDGICRPIIEANTPCAYCVNQAVRPCPDCSGTNAGDYTKFKGLKLSPLTAEPVRKSLKINFNWVRARAIRDFNLLLNKLNQAICEDTDYSRVIIPVRDIERVLDNLRNGIVIIGLSYDEDNEDIQQVINDDYEVQTFNPENKE